jgi:raffinose/stachyose/melibiose transport system substrate-binding protein
MCEVEEGKELDTMFRACPRILAVTLVALLVVGFAPQRAQVGAQDKVELLVWDQYTDAASDVVDGIYAAFEQANPNISIRREVYSSDQMNQTLATALGSGSGPDVVLYDTGPAYAGVLAEANLLLPLTDLDAQYGWTEHFVPVAIEGASIGGTLYGLPMTVDLIGLYYNKTLLDQEGLTAPTTFDQLLTFCTAAKEKGYTPIAFGDNPGWQAFHSFSMTSNQMIGAEAMRKLLFEGEGRWDTPEIATAIKSYFVDLREAGCFNDEPNAVTYDDANSLFYAGEALMATTGSWLVNDIEANMPDYEVVLTPFPEITGGQGPTWASGVGGAWHISASTEHATEAGMLLDFLLSDETAKTWVQDARFFLAREVDTTGLEIAPLFQSVLDVLRSAAAGETTLGYSIDVLAPAEFNDTMLNGFQAVLSGDKTAEQQAADLQAAWEAGRPATTGTPTT